MKNYVNFKKSCKLFCIKAKDFLIFLYSNYIKKIYKKYIKDFFKKENKKYIINIINKVLNFSMKTGITGIKRIINAFKYSIDGLKATYKSEEAFRQDIAISAVLFVVAIFCPFSFIEKILLISTLFFVIFAELINTAIEFTIDRISDDIHPLSKIAKDIGSSIVFVSFVYLVLVWVIILYANFF